MATSPVNGKPGVLLQKSKRPPNLMQPGVNGIKSFLPQPSPSPGSKRPPSASKHAPPTPTSHGNGNTTGAAGPRASNRRRDSQKPGEIAGRPNRTTRPGQIDGGQNSRLSAKRQPEPLGEWNWQCDRCDQMLTEQSKQHSIFFENIANPLHLSSSIYIPHIFDSISKMAAVPTTHP